MSVLVILTLSTLAIIAVSHILALQFFLYWKYAWFDIPMHFFGGVSIALGYGILPFLRIGLKLTYRTYISYLAVVLVVGLGWEVFEIVGGINVIDEYFVSDTLIDLVVDLLGGTVGYALVKRLQDVH